MLAHRMKALALALAAAGLLGGCATSGNPKDPLEGFNRAMFDINDGLDKAIVKPVAQGYDMAMPPPLRTGVTNFFGNIDDVFIAVNNLLQGKVVNAAGDVGRVFINTTIGLLGILDVASELGIEKHDEDFGQTLGQWGIVDGPYLVLPILGPSTVRDAFGKVADIEADPVTGVHDVPTRNSMIGLRGLNERARVLPTDKIVEEAALDRYTYIRDAYLQLRRSKIYDGDPPRETENFSDEGGATAYRPLAIRLDRVIGSNNLFVEREDDASSVAAQVEAGGDRPPAGTVSAAPQRDLRVAAAEFHRNPH